MRAVLVFLVLAVATLVAAKHGKEFKALKKQTHKKSEETAERAATFQKELAAARSAMKDDGQPYTMHTTWRFDTDITGDAFGGAQVANDVACAIACENRVDCNAWVFVSTDKKCWMKQSPSGDTYANGIVSGYMSRWVAAFTNIQKDKNIIGSNVDARGGVSQPEHCGAWCSEHPNCVGYVWTGSGNTCWLKKEDQYRVNYGSLTSASLGGRCAMNILPDKDLMGQDIWGQSELIVKDEVDCATRCCNYGNDCKSWTFQKGTKKCWLKSGVPSASTNTGLISGTKTAAWTYEANLERTDYAGFELSYDITDFDSCANWCFNQRDCKSWTFEKSQQLCWIQPTAPRASGVDAAGHFTGVLTRF